MSEETDGRSLLAASYNIHSWKGTDGRHDPERIMRVVAGLDADMVALQEVVSPQLAGAHCSLGQLARDQNYHVTFGPTMLRTDTRYGNALLSRREPMEVRRHELNYSSREPRGALEATFDYEGTLVRVLATHLGLARRERARQMHLLDELLQRQQGDIILLMGDLNDWLPRSAVRHAIKSFFGTARKPRTFPSRWPVLALDRIHVHPADRVLSLRPFKTPLARVASDHLPVLARIDLR